MKSAHSVHFQEKVKAVHPVHRWHIEVKISVWSPTQLFTGVINKNRLQLKKVEYSSQDFRSADIRHLPLQIVQVKRFQKQEVS